MNRFVWKRHSHKHSKITECIAYIFCCRSRYTYGFIKTSAINLIMPLKFEEQKKSHRSDYKRWKWVAGRSELFNRIFEGSCLPTMLPTISVVYLLIQIPVCFLQETTVLSPTHLVEPTQIPLYRPKLIIFETGKSYSSLQCLRHNRDW